MSKFKLYVIFLIIFLSSGILNAKSNNETHLYIDQNSRIFIQNDSSGNPKLYTYSKTGQLVVITNEEINKITTLFFEKAKSLCQVQYRPESFTGSLGIISITWNLNQICKMP